MLKQPCGIKIVSNMVRTNSYTPHYLPQCCCKLQAAVDKFLQSDCLWTSHTHEIQWSQPVSEHIKKATFSWLASLKWLSNASQNMGSMCFTSLINLIFWFSFKLILRARVCIYSYRKRSDSIINNLKHWYYFIGKSNMPHNLVVMSTIRWFTRSRALLMKSKAQPSLSTFTPHISNCINYLGADSSEFSQLTTLPYPFPQNQMEAALFRW